MSYIRNNLMPNEKILFSARVHPAIFLPSALVFLFFIFSLVYTMILGSRADVSSGMMAGLFFLISISSLLVSILTALQAMILMLTTEFAVTNRRVFAKTGFIRRNTMEILLVKVESIAVRQNIVGRLMNFGTVTVTGTGGTSESFKVITNPITIRKKITQVIERSMQATAEHRQQDVTAKVSTQF
jgi:uncharacterized membrane protein YdbT with pleckstrin-like domain